LFNCQWPDGSRGPYAGAELHLEQLSLTCTEVWLQVSLSGVDSASQGALPVVLKRDGAPVESFSFLPPDTIVKDTGLQPGHTYLYRVVRSSGTGSPSPEVTVTTLDTTSHDFVWEIDTLGDYGSYLNDVAIINENDIWAVGYLEVTEYDSAGNRHTAYYDAVHWDGDKWNFEIIGPVGTILYSIYAFSDGDIWVSNYCSPFHWDGNQWTYFRFSSGGVGVDVCAGNAIWGSSPDDVYFVGTGGSIVHWDGEGFEKLESGTDIRLTSISGVAEPKIGNVKVWAGGWEYTRRGQLLFYDGDSWSRIWDAEHPFYPDHAYIDPGAIWCTDWGQVLLYIGGHEDGIVVQHLTSDFNQYEILLHNTHGAFFGIHGNGLNDYFLVGDFNNVMHFNGVNFRRYPELAGENQFVAIGQVGDYVFICDAYAPIVVRGVRVP